MPRETAKKADPARSLDASCRVLILHGEETFLRTLYTQQLRDALAKTHGDVDTVTFDGTTAKAADVLDECRSFGLIATHKMIVVDNADQLVKEDNRPLFERYAEAPSEGATLVLRSTTWRPGKLDKIVEAVGMVKKCEALRDADALAWALARCKKRYDCAIERDAAALLVERVGSGLGRLDTELAKLASATEGGKGSITRDLVAQFVGASREEEVWSLQGVLLGGDATTNVRTVRDALDVSGHPPQLVIWAMSDLAKKVHGCAAGLRGGANPFALAKTYKLWGPSAEAVMGAAKQCSPARARALLRACVEMDWRLKSGLGEADLSFQRLSLDFVKIRA